MRRESLALGSLRFGVSPPSSPNAARSRVLPSYDVDRDLRDSFRSALYHGSPSEVRGLLTGRNLARLNKPLDKEHDRKLPLHVAVSRGIEFVELLLDAGADVDGMFAFSGTALQNAAEDGNLDVVALLLERGADVNAKSGWRGSALIAASRCGHADVVEVLLLLGAEPDSLDGYRFATALTAASDVNIIRLLLEYGASVQKLGRDEHALVKAVKRNDVTAVGLLLEHGANPRMTTHGRSVLSIAEESGTDEIVRLLKTHISTSATDDTASSNAKLR
jgi:ankyrin repeat protein